MRVRGVKAFRSTADKLQSYREELRKHYEGLRNPNKKQHPKPSRNVFPMNIQHLVEKIDVDELKKHESMSAK